MNRIVLAILACLVASPSLAQGACAPRDAAQERLRTVFGEYPVVTATSQTGVPIMMTANPETGTWTLLMVSPESVCVMISGQDFEAITAPVGNPT